MGQAAVPAIPILGRLLTESLDDEISWYAVVTLSLCGPQVKLVIPSLIECVAERGSAEDAIGSRAEQILMSFRGDAVLPLRAAFEASQGDERKHLERTLAMLDPRNDAYAYLEDLDDDKLIAMFEAVGDVLAEMGPMSWRNIAVLLEDKALAGQFKGPEFGISEATLRTQIPRLAGLLKLRSLTAHGRNAKKKGGLTDVGKRLLRDAKEYLRRKELRRKYHKS